MSLVISNTNFWGDVVDELAALVVTQNEIVDAGAIYISDGILKKRAVPSARVGLASARTEARSPARVGRLLVVDSPRGMLQPPR